MANRFVRIYNWEKPGIAGEDPVAANAIGFSASAFPYEGGEARLYELLDEGGYAHRIIDSTRWQPEGSVSATHIEVVPPLSDEHIVALGELCTHGGSEGPIIDAGSNGVYVIDNRNGLPWAVGRAEQGVVVAFS